LWRCGDGLFFEVPPLASDALLTTLHPRLENVNGKQFLSTCSAISKGMRWEGRVARICRCKINTKFWLKDPKGSNHSENVGVDGRIILEWILEK